MSVEGEPVVTLNFENGELDLPRSRTILYTFLGREALAHMFLLNEDQPNPERHLGQYVWADKIGNKPFFEAAGHMVRLGFEAHLNAPAVPASDQVAYYETHEDIDEPPLGVADEAENWLNGQQ